MKYHFKKERDNFEEDNQEVYIENENVTLPEILQDFKCFLLACGFSFKGDVVIESEEE